MSSSPSLRDVAEKAGVSRSTASRALQHHPMVALKTRERVEAAAAELGYQPDQVVSGLMRRHRHNREMTPQHTRIAWINSNKEEHSWHTVPYHIQARQGAQRRAEALNMEIEDIWLGQPGMKVSRLEQILYSRGIQGAILPSPNRPVEDYGFQLDHLALVVMGGHPQHRGRLTQILPDEFANMTAAMAALRERGYERIAFCTNGFINWASEFRLEAAYRQAQQDLKTKNRLPVFTFEGKQDRETLLALVKKHQPDALLTIWGETVEWLEDAGYDVPDDIGVVTLNLTEHTPGWTGIRQNQHAMASAAVDAVLAQLARFETGYTDNAKRMLIDGDWMDGNTTR